MPDLTLTTYRLYFQTPLHIGDRRPDDYGRSEDFIRSDVLQAAVLATWAKTGRPLPPDGDTGFTISSLFPFSETDKGEVSYFFPRIKTRLPLSEALLERRLEFAKQLKKLRWLDQTHFEKQLHQEPIEDEGFLAGPPRLLERQTLQRVTVPRDWEAWRKGGEDPAERNTFYTERLLFQPSAGLYFLVQFHDDAQEKALQEAFDLLQYEGLGTDRSVGNGQFTYQTDRLTLRVPEAAGYRTNLSLLCPDPKTLDRLLGRQNGQIDEKITFELIRRGGWITLPAYQGLRKKNINMFAEGSVFRGDDPIAGRPGIDLTPDILADTPGFRIWRCGRSLMLPVKTKRHEG